MNSYLMICLGVVLLSCSWSGADGRYINNPAYTHAKQQQLQRHMLPRDQDEPTLFELLISALREDGDMFDTAIEPQSPPQSSAGGVQFLGGDGEKRDNFKQAKPCYWSLVSCYRRKRGQRDVERVMSVQQKHQQIPKLH